MPAGRPPIVPDEELTKKVAGFVAAGHYMETAAAFAGVAKHTYLKWLREGRRFLRSLDTLPEGESVTDPIREAYAAFTEAIDRATATAEVRDLTVIDRVAQGGLAMGQTTRTMRRVPLVNALGQVVRDEAGQIVMKEETTEVISEAKTLPQWQAAAWRLERRNPDRWSRYNRHHVSNKKGELLPVEAMRDIIEGNLDENDIPDMEI